MFVLNLIFGCLTWAQPLLLNPIDVAAEESVDQSTRSVYWPVVTEKPTPAIQLPQIDDALNSSNGLQSRTQGSPTFSIRGSAQNGRALVLLDHIPLNFSSGFGAPRIFLPKESVSHLHVIKGPASLLYGSQAMVGAIDFVSKKYTEPELNINFSDTNESFLPWREGALAHQSYQLATPLYQNKKTHLQASFFYEDDDGAFPFQNKTASGVRSFNAQNLSRLQIKGSHKSSWWLIDFNSLIGKQILQSPGGLNFPLTTRQETEGALLSVSPHFFFSDQHSLKSRISFLESRSDFLETGTTSFSNQTTKIVQNEWVYDFKSKSKLQFFADAFFHELNNSFVGQNLKQDNLEIGPLFTFNSSKQFRHQVGARYLARNDKFLPSLSTHFLFANADAWLSYSEGFRNPTLTDLFSNSPFFIGNPNLEAETSNQYELGIKWDNKALSNKLSLEVRAFHIDFQNFMESFEITPGVFSRQNQGQGFSRGADVNLRWSRSFWLNEIDYNYLDTKNQGAGRPFRLSPRHQLTLGSTLKWHKFQFQVQNTHWYKTIDVLGNQAIALEDWQQWNFFLHIFNSKKSRISLGLINAFNEGKQLTLNYPEPQRKYWLQLHQRF